MKDLPALAAEDEALISDCLLAAVAGPWFEDWEFHTLFGLDRSEVEGVARGTVSDPEVRWLAINNAFANLLGYPGVEGPDWERHIAASRDDVQALFKRWRELRTKP